MVFGLLSAITIGDQPDFLPSDVVAQYEAGFGVLLVNANIAAVIEADATMKRAINHESYHHLQAICTGYGWKRSQRIRSIVVGHINASERQERKDNGGLWRAIRFLGWLPARIQRAIDVPRINETLMAAIQSNWRARLAHQTDPNDPSLAAAEYPGLFADLEGVRDDLWRTGTAGLSAGHVMEGSAVAHDVLLTALTLDGPGVLQPSNGEVLDQRIEAEAAPLGPEYSHLLAVARTHCGHPVAPWLLPSAALALQYERPGEAFLPLLDRQRASPPENALDVARAIAAELPAIPEAGEALGTARRFAGRERRWSFLPWRRREVDLHKQALEALAAGPVDELSVLTDLQAFGRLEGRIISCAIRCNDHVVGIEGLSPSEAAVRVMGANLALRAQTRRGAERGLEAELVAWAQKVLNRSFHLSDGSGEASPPTPG